MKYLVRQEQSHKVIGGVTVVKHLTMQEQCRETGKGSMDQE